MPAHGSGARGTLHRRAGKGGLPERALLDFDATDDPAHGDQEGAYYHGFYQEHILHPLLVFDGDTGQLISALLSAGNTHASRGALSILKRIVGRLREAWEGVKIEIRADAGFAIPEVCDYCEKEGIGYTIGLTPTRGSQRSPIISSAEPNGSPRSTKQRR